MKCVILLSFIEAWTPDFVRSAAAGYDYLICADGGEMIAAQLGPQPDCVVGDFDSDRTTERFDCLYITYPAEKDLTDSEAALLHAVERGCRDITVIGGIGGRLDHTVGSIAMLLKFAKDVDHLEFRDGNNAMFLLTNGEAMLHPSDDYKYFGLWSIDPVATGVTITGAKYPLTNAVLPRDTTLGISNEITGSAAHIIVRDGTVLVMRSRDHR